jgi:hypothetical protein
MKNITIFGLWILTVIIGSIIFGIGVTFMESDFKNGGDSFMIIVISAMMSFLFSIPAIIVFLISNSKLQKTYSNPILYQRNMYKVKLLTGIIYALISIVVAAINGADFIGIAVILGLLLSYLPIGLLFWYFGFKMNTSSYNNIEDVIDNPLND